MAQGRIVKRRPLVVALIEGNPNAKGPVADAMRRAAERLS